VDLGVGEGSPLQYAAQPHAISTQKENSCQVTIFSYSAPLSPLGQRIGTLMPQGVEAVPYAPLRCPTLPYAALRSPTLPYAPIRSPTLPYAPLRSPTLPYAPFFRGLFGGRLGAFGGASGQLTQKISGVPPKTSSKINTNLPKNDFRKCIAFRDCFWSDLGMILAQFWLHFGSKNYTWELQKRQICRSRPKTTPKKALGLDLGAFLALLKLDF